MGTDGFQPAAFMAVCYEAGRMIQSHVDNWDVTIRTFAQRLHGHSNALEAEYERFFEAQSSLNFFTRSWDILATEQVLKCPVCLDKVMAGEVSLLRCGHSVCQSCMERITESQSSVRCPVCRQPFHSLADDTIKLNNAIVPQGKKSGRGTWSSKLCSVIDTLKDVRKREPHAKIIAFTQWEELRGQFSEALNQIKIPHMSLCGDIFERTRTLERFQTEPEMSILLLSLEDSACGTNLTAASHVFLLHPMLATSPEEATAFETQAVGRVRRLGQTRVVHVWRFVVRSSVEEQLWQLGDDVEGQIEIAGVEAPSPLPGPREQRTTVRRASRLPGPREQRTTVRRASRVIMQSA